MEIVRINVRGMARCKQDQLDPELFQRRDQRPVIRRARVKDYAVNRKASGRFVDDNPMELFPPWITRNGPVDHRQGAAEAVGYRLIDVAADRLFIQRLKILQEAGEKEVHEAAKMARAPFALDGRAVRTQTLGRRGEHRERGGFSSGGTAGRRVGPRHQLV
ncbi:hypothetical protein [Novosphingopyxis sp. YJ-S2-01]|uniref:hypothetical protein n=1 Tax=Novosphingopyxis sp. YJ-S2-01 TaxID=2794021 RepID=UPI0018DB7A9D|nr:hypothetical protein [Novosphingopyxis sp. YJ-S2-01]MBH9538422.1 hypothetical protein [Novosphingopyxis sp. YJ-S2-01]